MERFEHFVDEKKIGEERPYVDRRVQVVDDLRADGWLREHESECGLRVAAVTADDGDEGPVRLHIDTEAADVADQEFGEAIERCVELLEEFADLVAGAGFTRKALGGVGEEEL